MKAISLVILLSFFSQLSDAYEDCAVIGENLKLGIENALSSIDKTQGHGDFEKIAFKLDRHLIELEPLIQECSSRESVKHQKSKRTRLISRQSAMTLGRTRNFIDMFFVRNYIDTVGIEGFKSTLEIMLEKINKALNSQAGTPQRGTH